MQKLKLHSPDMTQGNIASIRELFPNCVTEARDDEGQVTLKVDFDLLRQELSGELVEGPQERYRLDWPGKRQAMLTANAPIRKTLRPCRAESLNFDTTENLYIEGDNLEALKLLQESYLGKVKMIYIDPPYNTGNDFIYKDNFAEEVGEFLFSDGQRDGENNRMVPNFKSNGRFHSDWCSMIYPRLKIARNLLTDNGAIFVSCDEGENPRIRFIMDEIFGKINFIADIVWAAGRKNDSQLISISHEYIISYAKNKELLRNSKIEWRQKKKGLSEIYTEYNRLKNLYNDNYIEMTKNLKIWFKNLPDTHPSKLHRHYSNIDYRGIYFPDNISWPGGGGPKYEVLHPVTNRPVRIPSRGWMTSDPKKMQAWIDDDRVHFGEDENSVPCIKSYLKDKELQTPYSVFYQDGRASSKRLRALLGNDIFDFPKDEYVLQEIIEMCTAENDVILDFFSGSATTAHAVMQLNAEDGGKRKFIMVQLPEICPPDSEAAKAGFKNICEIGKERIRRAGKKIKEEKGLLAENLDTGFRVLKVATSCMEDVEHTPEATKQTSLSLFDNIKPDRSPEDLLFQVLLDWGVELHLPITPKTIQGKQVFFVADNSLAACFDMNINEDFIKELASHKPLRVVFRDAGFSTDAARINAEQIFKQLSPDTEVRVL